MTLGQQESFSPEEASRFVAALDTVLRARADLSPLACVRNLVPNDEWLFGLAELGDAVTEWLLAPGLEEWQTSPQDLALMNSVVACAEEIRGAGQMVPGVPDAVIYVGGLGVLGVLAWGLWG